MPKNKKLKPKRSGRFFRFSRRIFFSLALFVLVFVAATIVRVQAGTEHSVIGWLWGGSEEVSDGNSNNGLSGYETGLGWISMNNINPEIVPPGSKPYGVNIPSADEDVTGYAWSERIGWVSFNEADLTGCPSGICKAYRSGNSILGWARILGIKNELAADNSGGWQGWISLNGPNADRNGVHINVDDGILAGFGWSASASGIPELGWINFSQAKIPVAACTLSFDVGTPPDYTFTFSGPKSIIATRSDGDDSKTINLSNIDTDHFVLNKNSCSSPGTPCSFVVSAVNNPADGSPTAITATSGTIGASDYCTPASTTGTFDAPSSCTMSCPDSILVPPNTTKTFSPTCSTGECSGVSCTGDVADKFDVSNSGNDCQVQTLPGADFSNSTTVEIRSSCEPSCLTKVFVKRLGWIETNP